MLKFFKRKTNKGKGQDVDAKSFWMNPLDIPLILDSLMVNMTIEELKVARFTNHTWNSCALRQFHLRNDQLKPINLTRCPSSVDRFHQDLANSLKPTLFRNFKIGINFSEQFFSKFRPTRLEIIFKTFCEQQSSSSSTIRSPKYNFLYGIGEKVIDSEYSGDYKIVIFQKMFQYIEYFSVNLRSISLGGFFKVKLTKFEDMIGKSEVKFPQLEEITMCFFTDWNNHETVESCVKILTLIVNNSHKCRSLILSAIPHNLKISKIFEDFTPRFVPNLTNLSLKSVYDPNFIAYIPQDLLQMAKYHGLCLNSLKNEVFVSRARFDDDEADVPGVVQSTNEFFQLQENSLTNLDISIINWFQPFEQNLIDLSRLCNLNELSIKLRKSHFDEEFTTILKPINLDHFPLLKKLKLIEFDNYPKIFYGVCETMKNLSLIECTPKKFTTLHHQFPNLETIQIQSLANGSVEMKICKKWLGNWAHSLKRLILVGEISEVELKIMNLKKFLHPVKGLVRLELLNIDWTESCSTCKYKNAKKPEISSTFLNNLKIQSLAVKNIKMNADTIKRLHQQYKFEYTY